MTPENVIRTYSDMVYRIAFARAGTKEDADDIYQEVFLRFIRKKPEFRDGEHAKAWFIKVAVNCSRKFLGGTVRKREVSGEWMTETDTDAEEKGLRGLCVTPEERIFADEGKKELYRELQMLSADARLLLHLYYFEEMKTGEIAKLMHRKESTVRVQLTRAREKLIQRVPAEEEEEWMSGTSVRTTLGQNKEITIEIVSSEDDPEFAWYFELGDNSSYQATHTFRASASEEEYAWDMYEYLNLAFADEFKKGTKNHEVFLAELTKCTEKIGTETGFKKACVQGIQWFMDDLTEGRNVVVESWPVYDPVNRTEDGDSILLGRSFYRFDLDEWKKETEKNGTTEFVVESCAGVENKMVYTVASYEPFSCTSRRLRRPE